MVSYFKTEEEFLAPVGYEEIVYNKLNRGSDILSPLPSSIGGSNPRKNNLTKVWTPESENLWESP